MTVRPLDPAHDLAPGAERRWRETQATLRRLRGRRGRARERLFWTYVALLIAIPLGVSAAAAVRDAGPLAEPEALLLMQRLAAAGPAVLLGLAAAALRVAAWHGVVVVSRADVAWLLAAPVPRVSVLRPRLARILWPLAASGGLIGLVAAGGVGLTVGAATPALALAVGAAVGSGAALATLIGAVGWLVQCRPKWAARVLRAAPVIAAASAALAIAGWYGLMPPAAAAAAAWSGPWGWAVLPLLAAVGRHLAPQAREAAVLTNGLPGGEWAAVAAGVMLIVMAVVAVAAACRQLRAVPIEELRRREGTSTRVLAAATYAADLRAGSQARREAIAGLVGRRPRSRRGPARPWLAEPWSSALLLVRSRDRIAHAILWVGAAAAAAFDIGEAVMGAAAVPVVVVVAYPAGSALLEPLRIELEQRFLSRTGLRPLDSILRRLAIGPAALLTMAGGLAVTSMALAGLLSLSQALVLLLMAPAAAVLLLACAAVAATGPAPEPAWLYSGDVGVMLLFAHLTQGAHLAAAVIGLPVAAATFAVAQGVPVIVVVLSALVWAAAATGGLQHWSCRRLARYH